MTGIDAEAAGSSVSIGVPTAGRIPGGTLVERAVETPFGFADNVVLNVAMPDFATAAAIVEGINREFGGGTARAIDGASIAVQALRDLDQRVSFMGDGRGSGGNARRSARASGGEFANRGPW